MLSTWRVRNKLPAVSNLAAPGPGKDPERPDKRKRQLLGTRVWCLLQSVSNILIQRKSILFPETDIPLRERDKCQSELTREDGLIVATPIRLQPSSFAFFNRLSIPCMSALHLEEPSIPWTKVGISIERVGLWKSVWRTSFRYLSQHNILPGNICHCEETIGELDTWKNIIQSCDIIVPLRWAGRRHISITLRSA